MYTHAHTHTQAALLRSSQPLVGPGQKRCREDVQLLNACLHSMAKGRVLDVRSQQQAHNHMSKGTCTCTVCSSELFTSTTILAFSLIINLSQTHVYM